MKELDASEHRDADPTADTGLRDSKLSLPKISENKSQQ